MRIRKKSHWLHPVLRRHGGDFPKSRIETHLEVSPGDPPELRLDFELRQPQVERAIQSGEAQCAAMIYCAPTLFRRTKTAPQGKQTLIWSIPKEQLSGVVEVHPFVAWSKDNKDWPDAHQDYQGRSVLAPRRSPLAVDQTWRFRADHDPPPAVTSMFSIVKVPDLPEGEADVTIDLQGRLLEIRCHPALRKSIKTMPMEVLRPGLLLSVMVEALGEMKTDLIDNRENWSTWHPHGWAMCLWRRLKKLDVDLLNEGTSLFRAAQKTLENPLPHLTAWIERGHEGAYDGPAV